MLVQESYRDVPTKVDGAGTMRMNATQSTTECNAELIVKASSSFIQRSLGIPMQSSLQWWSSPRSIKVSLDHLSSVKI